MLKTLPALGIEFAKEGAALILQAAPTMTSTEEIHSSGAPRKPATGELAPPVAAH